MKKITLSIVCLFMLLAFVNAEDTLFFNPQVNATFFKKVDSLSKKVGEDSVFSAFEAQLNHNTSFDFSNEMAIRDYMTQAEILLCAKYYPSKSGSSILYESMGDQMLTVLMGSLKTAIDANEVKAKTPFIAYLVNRLADNHKFIDIKMGNTLKTWGYIKQGRFDYVFRKLTTTYVGVTLRFCGVFLVLLMVFVFRKRIIRFVKTGKWGVNRIKRFKKGYISPKSIILNPVVILLSTALFVQTSCAQPPTTGDVTYCDLVKLERDINTIEKSTQEKIYAINTTASYPTKISIAPQFRSVWEGYQKVRPSKMQFPDTLLCDKRLFDVYNKNVLVGLLNQAKLNFKTVGGSPNVMSTFQPPFSQASVGNPIQDYTKYKYSPSIPFVKKEEVLDASLEAEKHVEHIFARKYQKNEHDYDCVIVNPNSTKNKIDFLWKGDDGKILGSFGQSIAHLKKHKKTPLMLMNAGIFDEQHSPMGAFYTNGKKICKFNDKEGTGNFFMNPAGVFIIEHSGAIKIKTKEAFLKDIADTIHIKYATQSGPMLVINGKIHSVFNPNSTNRYIRNGVGVRADGRIVFVISKEPVTFYEFAQVFKDRFLCTDALYLDGAISQMYMPLLELNNQGGGFAGIIAISQ
jgi:uncharacterized protein YigE (DUF2233 family)